MSTVQDDDQLDTFVRAIQSLKLYRRAELKSQSGQELIEELYVDPLPNEHVLRTMIQPHTTFLVGRKGTGKSTVFQRAQFELRKNAHVATAYVDIKSVFESSRVDPAAVQMVENSGGLPHEALERLWLNREFFLTVLRSIREELEKLLRGASFWAKIKNRQRFASVADLFRELDELISAANSEQFENVLGLTQRDATRSSNWSVTEVENARFKVGAGLDGVSVRADVGSSDENVVAGGLNISDSDLMLRVFDLRGMIAQLKVILAEADITSLYVFLDDFSELPEDAMRTVVDGLLAPLNNWSDELIKFKIAAYPGRIYFGGIDPSKADQVNLDIYNLYGSSDVVEMEDKSVEFTRRLVERRLRRFGEEDMGVFFDMKEDVWRQLFQASMANPRALGYILYFAYESALIYGRKIGAGVIRDASRKYYEDKIQAGFDMNRFLNVSFSERSSLFGLRELLEMIVDRARELRRSSSPVIRDLEGRAPTSHFHVDPSMDQLLNTLELSFFITKYSSMRNKDGRKVSVYALNYGLCQQQKLEYGRPAGARDKRYRQYFVERIFDFTATVSSYIKHNQEIVCRACDAKHDLELLSAIRAFGMSCPTCRVGTCELINLSRKYEEELQTVEESSLLPAVELGILLALNAEQEPIGASEVAGELDCSYQLVGRRVKNLDERGLVDRDTHNAGRRRYVATDLARTVYFSEQTAPD